VRPQQISWPLQMHARVPGFALAAIPNYRGPRPLCVAHPAVHEYSAFEPSYKNENRFGET
jgi:hypothetical protein